MWWYQWVVNYCNVTWENKENTSEQKRIPQRILVTLCCSIRRLAAKTHFLGQILLQKDSEVCNTVRWQCEIEGSHAVSGFVVILEHLYTVVQHRLLRVGNCPSPSQLATAQTWASWLKLALNCCPPATGMFCLLPHGNNRPPFWHALPFFNTLLSISHVLRLWGETDRLLAMSGRETTSF